MNALPSLPLALVVACAAAVAVLLWAEWRGHAVLRAVAKLGAASCFVALAWVLCVAQQPGGVLLLAALAASWCGDALLLSHRSAAFLAGLGAFLLGHLLFALAFAQAPLKLTVMAWAALPLLAFGLGVLRWLWPHAPPDMRGPVVAYVTVILAMVLVALGHSAATPARWEVAAGALLFAASDLAVARDRFVQPALVNRLWGLPAYFAAQLLLAASLR